MNPDLETTKYCDFVYALKKSQKALLNEATGHKLDANHMAIGVASEAGELLDCVKKYVIYNKPIDMTNLVEELGDIEFYLEGLRQSFNIKRSETLLANKDKLAKRYESLVYTDQEASDRKDKS